jgi:hypothetical protein
MKKSPGWLKLNIFFEHQKCLAKNLKFFCFVKNVILYAFDDNLSATDVFINQICRAVEVAPPPSPSPHRTVQEVG